MNKLWEKFSNWLSGCWWKKLIVIAAFMAVFFSISFFIFFIFSFNWQFNLINEAFNYCFSDF